jgi:hypothetical protein
MFFSTVRLLVLVFHIQVSGSNLEFGSPDLETSLPLGQKEGQYAFYVTTASFHIPSNLLLTNYFINRFHKNLTTNSIVQ